MRMFETGATRDSDDQKPDYEGFLSPLVLMCFGEYMTEHRVQADGSVRASDNWQKGIPMPEYMKSLWRHLMDLWTLHRGYTVLDASDRPITVETAASAILFNTQGYLHEHLKAKLAQGGYIDVGGPSGGLEGESAFPNIDVEGLKATMAGAKTEAADNKARTLDPDTLCPPEWGCRVCDATRAG